MIEGINPYQPPSQSLEELVQSSGVLQRAQTARTAGERAKVKEEFLAMFYKEILKQAIQPPNFSGEEKGNTISRTFVGDLFLQKMALELAQSKPLGESVLDE